MKHAHAKVMHNTSMKHAGATGKRITGTHHPYNYMHTPETQIHPRGTGKHSTITIKHARQSRNPGTNPKTQDSS
jgi:hypothetical protein